MNLKKITLMIIAIALIPITYKGCRTFFKFKLDEKLFIAAQNNNIQLAEQTIKQGADVNALHHFYNIDLQRPLRVAIVSGNPEMVEFLVQHGAFAKEGLGLSKAIANGGYEIYSSAITPEQWNVIREKQKEIIPILEKYNAPTAHRE
jgi:hypothetical protein